MDHNIKIEVPENVTDLVKGPISTLFGDAARHIGQGLSDKAEYWKLENRLKIEEKIRRLVEQFHREPDQLRELSYGESFRAVEAASLEEDDSVQDLWAALLFNAHDAKSGVMIEKTFVDLLKSISGPEALLLNALFRAKHEMKLFQAARLEELKEYQSNRAEIKNSGTATFDFKPSASDSDIKKELIDLFDNGWRSLSGDVRNAAIQNLFRLRCLGQSHSRLTVGNCFREQRVNIGAGRLGIQQADTGALDRVFGEFQRRLEIGAGLAEAKIAEPNTGNLPGIYDAIPEFSLEFTPLGQRLMNACVLTAAMPGAL